MYIDINIFFFYFLILDFIDLVKFIFIVINIYIKKIYYKLILLKV